jgi:hypothetical protein
MPVTMNVVSLDPTVGRLFGQQRRSRRVQPSTSESQFLLWLLMRVVALSPKRVFGEAQEHIAERCVYEDTSIKDDLIARGHDSGSITLSYSPACSASSAICSMAA